MGFQIGDLVMHGAFGLGRVISLEEKVVKGSETVLCYVVEISNMTIWVPVDGGSNKRLRSPISETEYRKLQGIFNGRGETLPSDRHQRRLLLTEILKDGSAEASCRVLFNLLLFKKKGGKMSDSDQALIRQTKKSLTEEISACLSISAVDAGLELEELIKD